MFLFAVWEIVSRISHMLDKCCSSCVEPAESHTDQGLMWEESITRG